MHNQGGTPMLQRIVLESFLKVSQNSSAVSLR